MGSKAPTPTGDLTTPASSGKWSTEIVHWNILSTGTIAGKLAAGLAEPPDTEFVAVGFGERHGTRKRQAITTFATRPRPSARRSIRHLLGAECRLHLTLFHHYVPDPATGPGTK